MSLEDSAKEEDVSVRATGNGIRENSDDSERRADADEDGGSDCEEGGSEGRAVAAADVPVVMNALEERLPEGEKYIQNRTGHEIPLRTTAAALLHVRFSGQITWK